LRNQIVMDKYYAGLRESWDLMSTGRQYALILAVLLALFLLLLLHVPLSGALLGSTDSLFIPALGNTYINRIQARLSGEFVGQAMYPADITRYGESSVGVMGAFMLFRVLGANDVYAMYLTQALEFSLMAFATLLFARHYTRQLSLALFAALVFTTSNFLWANADDLYVNFYFLPLLSAHFLKEAMEQRRARHLWAAGAVAGLQVYLSVQVFVYQAMILVILLLLSGREWWRAFSLRDKLLAGAAYVLIALPRLLSYLYTVNTLGVVDLWPISEQINCYYLQPFGFLLSAMPDKLISYGFVQTLSSTDKFTDFCGVRHLGFLGLGIPALAIVGLKGFSKQTAELVLIALAGFVFALGGTVMIGDRELVSPVQLLYEYVPLGTYLRVGLRSYTMFVLAMSVLASLGLQRIQQFLAKYGRGLPVGLFFILLLFVLAENVSWPVNRFETVPYPEVPDGYVEFFQDKPEALILDLPSSSGSWPGYKDEIMYVLWQTQHERNILGGVFGYYPLTRIKAQNHADLLPSAWAFRYFQRLGVTHFVWHDSPHLYSHPSDSFIVSIIFGKSDERYIQQAVVDFSWLQDSDYLKPVFSNDVITIYELRPR